MDQSKPLQQRLQEAHSRRDKCQHEIIQASRALVPVLKDHQMQATASELERMFFELDAISQETAAMIMGDTEGFIELLKEMGGGR